MTIAPKLNRNINALIHTAGLSCLGAAIFLQILVFSSILDMGYFRAVEANSFILGLEILLTGFSAIYFIYFYQKVIRATLSGQI